MWPKLYQWNLLVILELLCDGFGEECYFKVLLAELKFPPPSSVLSGEESSPLPPAMNERVIGYALYFYNYSTWEGRVMFLEDLFIRKQYKSKFS